MAPLGASGCYLSHAILGDRPDASSPPEAGLADGGLDASLSDAPSDAGPEASIDAPPDRGAPPDGTLDTEPPEPLPPDPGLCRIEPAIHPFDDPVLEYRWPDGPVVRDDAIHVCMTPLVIDLEPEGDRIEPELVFVSYPALGRSPDPGILRIVDPRTHTTLSYPADPAEYGVLEATGNLAAGDIDGDGANEIVGFGTHSGTYAFRADGRLFWTSAYPTASDRGDLSRRSVSGGPAIADLDGDGRVEIAVGRSVISGETGELIWRGRESSGTGTNQFFGPLPCVADLDGDGRQEVIAGNTAFGPDGSPFWTAPVPDGICAVADILADAPGPEVVLVARGILRVLAGGSGAILWERPLEGRVTLIIGGPPTVADFDGDGRPEIGVANGGAYGVYDPECEGPGSPAGCADAGVLWTSDTSDASSSGTGSSVFDFNGDGHAEVVYNDEYHFRIYDGTSGRTLFRHRNSSRTRTENPTIADVDNDGDAEIVFAANAEAFFLRGFFTDPGVEVWGDARGRWVGARRIWNQHAYHIDNVEESGRVPRRERPSWEGLNAYRQNLREGGDVLRVPDLWGGRGEYECLSPSRAMLRVRVGNHGLERLGSGVVVAFYEGHPAAGGRRRGEALTRNPLEPGESEPVELEVELSRGADGRAPSWYAALDDPLEPAGGSVSECREDNNLVLIWRPEC